MGWLTYKVPGLGKIKIREGLSRKMHNKAVQHELAHLYYPHLSEKDVRKLTNTDIDVDKVVGLAYPKRRK